jgi:hypothetical protein
MNDDTNWLRLSHITCPGCQREWHRVDHSPMDDDWRFYCDRCGNSVEVSFYDPHVMAIPDRYALPYHDLMRAITAKLRPCDCGGRYHHDSPRRCANCLTILVAGESQVDLYPFIYDFEATERDPTPEEQAEYGVYEDAHIRHADADIWEPE